jgi:hypothetical protein
MSSLVEQLANAGLDISGRPVSNGAPAYLAGNHRRPPRHYHVMIIYGHDEQSLSLFGFRATPGTARFTRRPKLREPLDPDGHRRDGSNNDGLDHRKSHDRRTKMDVEGFEAGQLQLHKDSIRTFRPSDVAI